MSGLEDRWALCGNRFRNPKIEEGSYNNVSSPREFDEENMIITTYSGSVYRLVNCNGDLEQQKQFIRDDVEKVRKELENAKGK